MNGLPIDTQAVVFDLENTLVGTQRSSMRRFSMPGVTETIGRLTGNYWLGVLTDRSPRVTALDLDEIYIPRNWINDISSTEALPYKKPDPGVFEPTLAALARAGIAPSQTVYVGDELVDFELAQNAGVRFVGVETGTKEEVAKLRSVGGDLLLVASLAELINS